FRQLNLDSQFFTGKPPVYLVWQNSLSPAQRLTFERSLVQAGAGSVQLVNSLVAAWIGLKKQKLVSSQALLLNIGAQTTLFGLVQDGQLICDYFVPQGIELIKKQIQALVREKYSLAISLTTADKVLTELVEISPTSSASKALVIRGKRLETGLPDTEKILNDEFKKVATSYLQLLLESWQLFLEKLPSSIQRELANLEIIIFGGGSQLVGLDIYLSKKLSLSVKVAADPQDIVWQGLNYYVKNKIHS
ncbi:MAG: hypothetical protein A2406_03130, partial [Candidatus Komeilibacteria bacterium RIFOXYC1_FULL_37_11]